jgi:hypothetical protein
VKPSFVLALFAFKKVILTKTTYFFCLGSVGSQVVRQSFSCTFELSFQTPPDPRICLGIYRPCNHATPLPHHYQTAWIRDIPFVGVHHCDDEPSLVDGSIGAKYYGVPRSTIRLRFPLNDKVLCISVFPDDL